jgi:hypothetical protein
MHPRSKKSKNPETKGAVHLMSKLSRAFNRTYKITLKFIRMAFREYGKTHENRRIPRIIIRQQRYGSCRKRSGNRGPPAESMMERKLQPLGQNRFFVGADSPVRPEGPDAPKSTGLIVPGYCGVQI